jgi:hypothetical protein
VPKIFSRMKSKSSRKIKKSNKLKKSLNNKKMKGGMGGVNIDSFFKGLYDKSRINLNNLLKESISSEKYTKTDLASIISDYEQKKETQLYDFIYEKHKDGKSQLTTIWDHETGKPESITAGMKGIHLYVIKNGDNNFEILGKFVRN